MYIFITLYFPLNDALLDNETPSCSSLFFYIKEFLLHITTVIYEFGMYTETIHVLSIDFDVLESVFLPPYRDNQINLEYLEGQQIATH